MKLIINGRKTIDLKKESLFQAVETHLDCKHVWVDHWDSKMPEYICALCGNTSQKLI